jgi:hypothetical protein
LDQIKFELVWNRNQTYLNPAVPPVTVPLFLLSLCRWAPPSGPAHLSAPPHPLLPHEHAARLSPASIASAPLPVGTPAQDRATPTGPPSPLHLVARQAKPLALFLSDVPSSCHKKASPDDVPRSPVFISQAPVHRASSPTSFPSTPHPPTVTERCWTTPDCASFCPNCVAAHLHR